jgi:hypothetical protein
MCFAGVYLFFNKLPIKSFKLIVNNVMARNIIIINVALKQSLAQRTLVCETMGA